MKGLVAILAVALTLVAGRADDVTLRWKLKAGDTFYAKATDHTEQTVSVAGTTQEMKTDHVSVSAYKVTKADADGYTIEQTVLQSTTDTNVIRGGVGDLDKQLEGSKLTYTLDKNLKVTKVEGADALVKKLTDANKDVKPLVEGTFSEGAIKKGMEDLFRGPGKAVKVGDEWKKDETTPMGSSGDLKAKLTYKYQKSKDGVEEVGLTGDATVALPKEQPADQPFKITKMNLKSDKYTGTLLFDSKAGRLKQSEEELNLKGTITIQAGVEVEADVTTKMTSKVEVSDKSPVRN